SSHLSSEVSGCDPSHLLSLRSERASSVDKRTYHVETPPSCRAPSSCAQAACRCECSSSSCLASLWIQAHGNGDVVDSLSRLAKLTTEVTPTQMTISQIKKVAVPILNAHGIRKAAVFGSVARGEETAASDLMLIRLMQHCARCCVQLISLAPLIRP